MSLLEELEQLKQKIDRLIALKEALAQSHETLRGAFEKLQFEQTQTLLMLEQSRHDCDILRMQCKTFSAKIEEAQFRLNAILEKLPQNLPIEGQLDLLCVQGNKYDHQAD